MAARPRLRLARAAANHLHLPTDSFTGHTLATRQFITVLPITQAAPRDLKYIIYKNRKSPVEALKFAEHHENWSKPIPQIL